MIKIGERIGAMQSADANEVRIFGFGIYAGDEIPPYGFLGKHGVENSKLVLDNGKVVWGFECWWSREEQMNYIIGLREHNGAKIIEVDIDEERERGRDPETSEYRYDRYRSGEYDV